jgi:hypothetical protein
MAKGLLKPEYAELEAEILKTFLAGHHEYRPDLAYPQSHSDMAGGIRALLKRFDVKPRAIPLDWADLYPNKEHIKV